MSTTRVLLAILPILTIVIPPGRRFISSLSPSGINSVVRPATPQGIPGPSHNVLRACFRFPSLVPPYEYIGVFFLSAVSGEPVPDRSGVLIVCPGASRLNALPLLARGPRSLL